MNAVSAAWRAVSETSRRPEIATFGAVAATVAGAIAMPLLELIAGGSKATPAS